MKRRVATASFASVLSAGMLLVLSPSAAVCQTVTTYTSAQTWQAAVQGSSQFTENFQEFSQDTYFQTGKLNTVPFSLQQIGMDTTYGYFENFVDVPPLQFTDNSGVANAALYIKFDLITVDMKFNSPVFAWGANFYGAQSGELVNLALKDSSGDVISTVPVTVDTGFFGFVISPSEGVSDIIFESQIQNPDPSIGQGMGLENVVGACVGTCVSGAVVYNPSSINFGNIVVGTKSQDTPITVTNNTSSVATYMSSTGLSEFASLAGSTCGQTLAAGASCTFNAYFAPAATGPATGSITISTSAGPVTFTMTGTGVAAATVVYSPSSVSFGDVVVGTTSATKLITVTNNTTSVASYLSSTGLSEFASVPGSTCGSTLAAGASCNFNAYFAPTATGAATGSITISTSAGQVTFTMSGTGVAASSPSALPESHEKAAPDSLLRPPAAPVSSFTGTSNGKIFPQSGYR